MVGKAHDAADAHLVQDLVPDRPEPERQGQHPGGARREDDPSWRLQLEGRQGRVTARGVPVQQPEEAKGGDERDGGRLGEQSQHQAHPAQVAPGWPFGGKPDADGGDDDEQQLEGLHQPYPAVADGEVAAPQQQGRCQRLAPRVPGPEPQIEHHAGERPGNGGKQPGRDQPGAQQVVDAPEHRGVEGRSVERRIVVVQDPPAEERMVPGVVRPPGLVGEEMLVHVLRRVGAEEEKPGQQGHREDAEDRQGLGGPGGTRG